MLRTFGLNLLLLTAATFGALAWVKGEPERGTSGLTPLSGRDAALVLEALGPSPAPSKVALHVFIDYECPACRAQYLRTIDLLATHSDHIAVTYHHFPLTQIHANAFDAALVAEICRGRGAFDAAHHLMMTGYIDSPARDSLLRKFGGRPSENELLLARSAVERDFSRASTLKIKGTPTYFLLYEGRAFWAQDLLLALEDLIGDSLNVGPKEELSTNASDSCKLTT